MPEGQIQIDSDRQMYKEREKKLVDLVKLCHISLYFPLQCLFFFIFALFSFFYFFLFLQTSLTSSFVAYSSPFPSIPFRLFFLFFSFFLFLSSSASPSFYIPLFDIRQSRQPGFVTSSNTRDECQLVPGYITSRAHTDTQRKHYVMRCVFVVFTLIIFSFFSFLFLYLFLYFFRLSSCCIFLFI